MYIDSFKNNSHFKTSEKILNRQKLNNNFKKKAVDNMIIKSLKLFISNQKLLISNL